MNPKRKYGETEFGPVNILPALTIDMSGGQPLPPKLGETEIPVNVLPELAFDMSPDDILPVLQLRLTLRPGATPGQVALDLFRLYAAINQSDLSQQGSGLLPGEASCEETTSNGTLSVT